MALGFGLHECPVHMSLYFRRLIKTMNSRDLLWIENSYNPKIYDGYWSLLALANIDKKSLTPPVQALLSGKLHRKMYRVTNHLMKIPMIVSEHVLRAWWKWALRKYETYLQDNFSFSGKLTHEFICLEKNMVLFRFHVQKTHFSDSTEKVTLKLNINSDYAMEVFQKKWFFYNHRLVVGIRHCANGESAVVCLNHRMNKRQYWLPTNKLSTLLTKTPRPYDPNRS